MNASVVVKLISSLEKCFLDDLIDDKPVLTRASFLNNEHYSFQMAYCRSLKGPPWGQELHLHIESLLAPYITCGMVGFVPSLMPAPPHSPDPDYLRTVPGLFPDPIYPFDPTKDCLEILPGQLHSVWFDIRPDGTLPAGEYPFTLILTATDGEELARTAVTFEVIPASLPMQTMPVTRWLYADCLADYYHYRVFSEEHWHSLDSFIRCAVRNGINCVLTPLFTPALDTRVNCERTTVQLVDITRTNGHYDFKFDKLERFISLCLAADVRYFEMPPLYTQWGANHAPKFMATDNGCYQQIFGWETAADDPAYQQFLHDFLKALTAYLKQRGIGNRCLFHISDEPDAEHIDQYVQASRLVRELLSDAVVIDAVAHSELCDCKALTVPVVSVTRIESFLEKKISPIWAYYCAAHQDGVAQCMMAMPAYRNRILGIQLYRYGIDGFLHWGYNFYNSKLSIRHIDPYRVTDCDLRYVSGDAFIVYPGENGEALESIRLPVFHQAIQDVQALALCESLYSHDFVCRLIEEECDKPLTFRNYPRRADYLLHLREKVNTAIKTAVTRSK